MIRVSTRGSEGRPPLGLCAVMEFMAERTTQTAKDIPELGGFRRVYIRCKRFRGGMM